MPNKLSIQEKAKITASVAMMALTLAVKTGISPTEYERMFAAIVEGSLGEHEKALRAEFQAEAEKADVDLSKIFG